jgi:long-chain acyl-CoA synthetase
MCPSYPVSENHPWFKSYPQGMPHHLDYPEKPLFQFLDDSAKKFPERTALIFYGREINYKNLKNLTDRFARALQDLGIKKGDRVALFLPNSPAFVIAYFGILKAGGVVIPLNPLYLPKELNYVLADSRPKALISLKMFRSKLSQLEKGLVPTLILSDLSSYLPFLLRSVLRIKNMFSSVELAFEGQLFGFEELLEKTEEDYQSLSSRPEDLNLLVYTSGTTGKPKGAELTQKNLVSNLIQTATWLGEAVKVGQDIELGVLPFFHIYGITIALHLPMQSALTLVLFPSFHSQEIAKGISKYKINITPTVPIMLQAVIKRYQEKPRKYDFSSVRFWGSGAGACSPELIETVNGLGEGKVIEGFGLTETSPLLTMNPLNGQQKLGSIGLPLPDTDCKVVNLEGGEEVKVGERGELLVRGPQVFSRYWQNEEKTKKVLSEDGWLRTKDIVTFDEDGYVFFQGRLDDVINVGGEKFWPQEVETLLAKHPDVEEVAVVGYPDIYFGEIPEAYVVPSKNCKNDPALQWELPEYCQEHLLPYKIPRRIHLVSKIPHSHIGKTLHYQLRKKQREEGSEKEGN